MAAATWCYHGDPEPEQPAVLVQFSNGRVRQADSIRFTVYRNKDTAHPRKKHRRILVRARQGSRLPAAACSRCFVLAASAPPLRAAEGSPALRLPQTGPWHRCGSDTCPLSVCEEHPAAARRERRLGGCGACQRPA